MCCSTSFVFQLCYNYKIIHRAARETYVFYAFYLLRISLIILRIISHFCTEWILSKIFNFIKILT